MIRDDSLEVLPFPDSAVEDEAVDEELGWKFEFSSCLSNWFLASSLFSLEGEFDEPEPDLVGEPPVEFPEDPLGGCTETANLEGKFMFVIKYSLFWSRLHQMIFIEVKELKYSCWARGCLISM